MATFHQENQNVNQQYNADVINFGMVHNKVDFAAELQKIQKEVKKAVQAGTLDEEVATDVEANLRKATNQAQKPNADKKTILDCIEQAKKLLAGVASAAGLVSSSI